MALIKGAQGYRYDFAAKPLNQEILNLEGYLSEDDAKIYLYKFLRNNVTFAAELLLGVKLFPFQALMIKGMMIGDFSMFVLSRGGSKSFIAGVFVLLDLILNQGSKIGVLSSGFRQAKFILLKCQDILNKKGAALANSCGFKFTRGTDQWTLTCGRSEAIALPLADGSKIRGFRFKKLLLDEFLNIPKNIFQEVILPFLGVVDNPTERTELSAIEDKLIEQGKMKKEDKFIWPSNKLIILSSPSFKFEYMYQVYCQYRDLIMGTRREDDVELTERDAYRIIFQMSYDCLPVELYDANLLKQAKATMSEMAFIKEFGGQFVDESDGYFRLSKMVLCTVEEGSEPTVEVAGNPQDKYLISFDPSWAENSDSDDFAIEVFKLHDATQTGTLVHGYGLSGAALNSHIEYMAYLLLNFNIVGMCGDYMGGLQFVNACNESEIFKDKGLKIGLLEGDFDDPTKYEEDLKEMKRGYRPTQRNFCYLRQPSSNWIREANELLQANIDHKRIHFAAGAHDSNFEAQRSKKIPISKLKWDNKFEKPTNEEAAMVDFIDHQKSMIELTKTQCANIEVISNPQGTQTFRLPLYMTKQKGPDRPRKDNYSALVLGNWFIKVYYDMINTKAERVFESFTPTVIK